MSSGACCGVRRSVVSLRRFQPGDSDVGEAMCLGAFWLNSGGDILNCRPAGGNTVLDPFPSPA